MTDVAAHLKKLLGVSRGELLVDLPRARLMEEAVAHDRGRTRAGGPRDAQKAFLTRLGLDGPLVFYSDPAATGRRVDDTFAVAYPEVRDHFWWKADMSPFDPDSYEALLARVVAYLDERDRRLYVRNVHGGVDPTYALPLTFVGEYATHALFADNMFPKSVPGGVPEDRRWTMVNLPHFLTDPRRDGTRSDAAVLIDLRRRLMLVLGPADYCGTCKKTVFSVLNYLLPDLDILPMHCSANEGPKGDIAVMFGLSGTGKTTLSADPDRRLLGDDEHAWSDTGVSNFEDGCYAKLVDLDRQDEPIIAAALSRAGTVIENVPSLAGRALAFTDPQELDLADRAITENTRFAYPLSANPNVKAGARGGHPETIVMLTADAFGVLPPVAVLDPKQAMYHFVSGYTSKLAGTEVGVTAPKATFSACFGAPFMTRKASVYARLLAEKMAHHEARCVLLNTGWSGGAYGVGKRMSIRHTRALLNAALRGDLDPGKAEYTEHPIFRLKMPRAVAGVPANVLDPRNTWEDKAAYDQAATKLRNMFAENFSVKGFGSLGLAEVM
jgi:phosphoenolpyruvate carboxykinase (ATP)